MIMTSTKSRLARLTSSTFLRIALNLVVSASRFLASREWPVCALLSLSFVLVNAIRVAKTFSLEPVPDIWKEEVIMPATESTDHS